MMITVVGPFRLLDDFNGPEVVITWSRLCPRPRWLATTPNRTPGRPVRAALTMSENAAQRRSGHSWRDDVINARLAAVRRIRGHRQCHRRCGGRACRADHRPLLPADVRRVSRAAQGVQPG